MTLWQRFLEEVNDYEEFCAEQERKRNMSRKEHYIESKALEALEGKVDVVHDIYTAGACVDVIGTIGGDEVHYRVYFKGSEVDFITCK